MLNIFNIRLKNNKAISRDDNLIYSKKIQHFSPAIKEWNNSLYSYNKNTVTLTPITSKIISRLLKAYFNLYNRNLESKIKKRRLRIRLKRRRFSSHKIYLSKSEFKHTNDNIYINIYIYNRQRYNYLFKIKRLKSFFEKRNFYFKRKIKRVKRRAIFVIKKWFKNKNLKSKYNLATRPNNILLLKLANDIPEIKKSIKKYITKSLRRYMLYMYYKRLLLLNELKFNYTYLNKITNLVKKIYNKNIEFNIVNLKYFYLNSDIFTESITNKITKNRKRLYRILKKSVQKVKISNRKLFQKPKNANNMNMLSIQKLIEINIKSFLSNKTKKIKKDRINILYYKIFGKYIVKNNKILKKLVMNSIKNKTITGVRLEAAGRLSKRHTASRSLFKLRYKGSLKNIDSSYNNISSKILRGNAKTNIQYTKLKSVVRIGSFGIKGWISNN